MMAKLLRKSVIAALVLLGLVLTAVCDEDKSPTSASLAPAKLKYVSGDNQIGQLNKILEQPLMVQILDHASDPVAAHRVVFEVTSASGALAGNSQKVQEVQTNANGMTSVYLVLGDSIEIEYTVQASAFDNAGNHLEDSPYLFTAGVDTSGIIIDPGPGPGGNDTPDDTTQPSIVYSANLINVVSGNYQGTGGEYNEGQTLPMPLVVQVLDTTYAGATGYPDAGAPVSGYPVLFTVYSPDGTATEAQITSEPGGGPSGTGLLEATTDDEGLAAVRLQLAKNFGGGTLESNLNNHRVEAVIVLQDGSQDSVIFFATGVPSAPVDTAATIVPDADRIELVSGNLQTGTPGTALSNPVIFAVYDSVGDPVAGAAITFVLTKGGGAVSVWGEIPTEEEVLSLATDGQGLVRLAWRLGELPAVENEIVAVVTLPDSSMSLTVSATGVDPDLGPDALIMVSGDGQTGEVASILPLALTVRVLNSAGDPVSAAGVTFTVVRGSGSVGESGNLPIYDLIMVETDDYGVASATFKLGIGPELDQQVVAEVKRNDGTGISVLFTAQLVPILATANRLVALSENYQGDFLAGTMIPQPLVVGVYNYDPARTDPDTLGVPIPNFTVLFQAFSPARDASVSVREGEGPDGTGRLQATTDADGLAAVRLTLGTDTGGPDDPLSLKNNNYVVAVAVFSDGSQDTVMFFASSRPGEAVKLDKAGSDQFTGVAGQPLSGLQVSVTDEFDNAKSGTEIGFAVTQIMDGGDAGVLAQSTVISDIYGKAASSFTSLSTKAGNMQVSASNGELAGSPVLFYITVLADVADEIRIVGGDKQTGAVNQTLGKPLVVMVRDQYGNPVTGAEVRFAVTSGAASLSAFVITGADGLAQTLITPGSVAVAVTATTEIQGVDQAVTFNITATP
jgi:Bacterial Ig-like domain (group 1)